MSFIPDTALADTFSRNARNHLNGADRAADLAMDNAALHAVAIAIELLLKSYLLRVATDDRWNRQNIGHDLSKAARYAERAGLRLPPLFSVWRLPAGSVAVMAARFLTRRPQHRTTARPGDPRARA